MHSHTILIVLFLSLLSLSFGKEEQIVRFCHEHKISIYESTFHLGSTVSHWHTNLITHDIFFVGTDDGMLYRSGDGGKNWVLQTSPAILPNISTTKLLPTGFAQSPVDPLTIILSRADSMESFTRTWITTNGGVTYDYVMAPQLITDITFHPNKSGVAYGFCYAGCETLVNGSNFYYTLDAGLSWNKAPIFPRDPSNGWMVDTVVFSPFPEYPDRLYAIIPYNETEKQDRTKNLLVWTENWFETYTVIRDNVDHFQISKGVISAITYSGQANGRFLDFSLDGGSTWKSPSYPQEHDKTNTGYEVYWSDSDNMITGVWLSKNTSDNESVPYANIYVGWYDDVFQSLRYSVARSIDFAEGLEGIVIGRVYSPSDPLRGPIASDDIVSVFSWDEGMQWEFLDAPSEDANGKPYNCSIADGCSLHFHGNNWVHPELGYQHWSYIYSTERAPGIILANGNVGKRLNTDWSDLNTYLSINGGVTWSEVAKGLYAAEFADSGGIILFVPIDNGPADRQMIFSLNEGHDFERCTFTNQSLKFWNLLPAGEDPVNRTPPTRFLGYGQRGDTAVVLTFDFSGVFDKNCTKEDYLYWNPAYKGRECLLGKKLNVERRDPTINCLTSTYEREILVSFCACQKQDYRCSSCYSYNETVESCVFSCPQDEDKVAALPSPPRDCGIFYEVDQGWVLMNSTSCNKTDPMSINPPKGLVPCNIKPAEKKKSNAGTVAAVVIVVLLIVCVIVVLLVLYKKNDKFRAKVKGIGKPKYQEIE